MSIFSLIIIFLLGTMIGSFLNVVIYRYQSGWGLGGRSRCLSCSKVLSWYELIPVFSFLALRGKCRTCHSVISKQYPIVECLAGLIFTLIVAKFQAYSGNPKIFIGLIIFHMFIWSLLIVIAVYDARHKIIPNQFVYAIAVFSLLRLFVSPLGLVVPPLGALAAGLIIPLPFFLLWVASKGRFMGLGDVKLMIGMGWYLGLSAGSVAILFSFWIGAIIAILLLLFKGTRFTMKSEIPFGPFLILGTLIVFLWNLDLVTLLRVFTLQ